MPATNRVSLTSILKERELWALFLLGVLYFYRPLFGGETLYYRDLFTIFLPQHERFVDIIKSGEFPLWDRYLHGGQPFLAKLTNTALYPSKALYLLMPPLAAMNFDLVFHLIAASVSAYVLARVLGLSKMSAAIVGLTYGFCGHTISHLVLNIRAIPYLPLMILAWHLHFLTRSIAWFVISAIVGALQFLSGSPEMAAINFVILIGWSLSYQYVQPGPKRLAHCSLLAFTICGLIAVQYLPAAEMARYSARSSALPYSQFAAWSVNPRRLPEMIVPGFLGFNDTLTQENYWGRFIEDPSSPYILSLYFGCLALALALYGFLTPDNEILSRRTKNFLLGVLLISVLLSCGRFLPAFKWIYEFIPFVTSFRFPVKIWTATALPVALLAGLGAELWFGQKHASDRSYSTKALICWFFCAALILVTLSHRFSDGFSLWFHQFFFKQSGGTAAREGLSKSFLHITAIWLLVSIVAQYRQWKRTPWQQGLIAVILGLDVLTAGSQITFYAPKQLLTDPPALARLVQDHIGNGRLYRVPLTTAKLRAPSNDLVWGYRWELETLNHNLASFYDVPLIFHRDVDGLSQREVVTLKPRIEELSWMQRLPLLSSGSVTLILTSDDVSSAGMTRLAAVPTLSTAPLFLYRNEIRPPRVWFSPNFLPVSSAEEALQQMSQPQFDAISRPVIESTRIQSDNKSCESEIKTMRILNNSSAFSVTNRCDGYLIFSEPFYPGWRASVDGNDVPFVKANYAFSAIFLTAGDHNVERKYRPSPFIWGSAISLLFFIALIASCFWTSRARQGSSNDGI